jgi:ribosomal protein L40E
MYIKSSQPGRVRCRGVLLSKAAMSFISCYECGSRLSDQAKQCPRCRTYQIRGVRCVLCDAPMKASSSVLASTSFSYLYLHQRCGARLFGHRGHCRECGTVLWGGWLFSWASNITSTMLSGDPSLVPGCRKCGAPNPLKWRGRCDVCQLTMFEQMHALSANNLRHRECDARHVAAR